MRARLATARVGELATVTEAGAPHIVPVCFALDGDAVVTAVDAKPKSTVDLRRLANVRANPTAALLVHHYDDADWSRLWWVRIGGSATVLEHGPDRERALSVLVAKYPQYREQPPPGAVIRIAIEQWRGWEWPR
jgi:PPOX class probable F420-dependent enzyme